MDKGTVYIGTEFSDQFFKFSPGEHVKMSLLCTISSLGTGSVSLDIVDCDINNVPKSMDDALRQAKSLEEHLSEDKGEYIRSQVTPYPG
jgi:hypothetical protein